MAALGVTIQSHSAGDEPVMCPVCTLFLRPGITLKQHLASHPKQKVIDALVKLSLHEEPLKVENTQSNQSQHSGSISQGVSGVTQTQPSPAMPPYLTPAPIGSVPNGANLPANHFFMYQQSMTASPQQANSAPPLPFNPFTQQYFVPAIYNAQMMPYIYQQQQLIMSSNGIPPHMRALPFEAPSSTSASAEVISKPSDDIPADTRSSDVQHQQIINNLREKICEKIVEKENEEVGDKFVEEQQSQGLEASENPRSPVIHDLTNNEGEKITELNDDDDVQLVREEDPLNVNEREESNDSPYKDEEVQDQEEKEQETDTPYILQDENSMDHNYPSQAYNEHDSDYENPPTIDHEECVGTPLSHTTNSEWNFNTADLDKACQTQNSSQISPRSSPVCSDTQRRPSGTPDFIFIDQRSNVSSMVFTSDMGVPSYEQSEPIYTSANIVNNSEGIDFMNPEDIEHMQVIIGDFPGAQMLTPVENFEPIRHENPPILMTISGDNSVHSIDQRSRFHQESCIEDVNIRSDEKMPPRGELSGQESMGSASDLTWNQIQHYQDPQNNAMCYEHNSWDSRDSDIHPFPEEEEEPDKKEISPEEPEKVFKYEPKETIVRSDTQKVTRPKQIGLEIGKRKVKKLVIKPKRLRKEKEGQSSFNNVFTNKLKVEQGEEETAPDITLDSSLEDNKDDVKTEIKIITCKECQKIFKTKKELKLHCLELHKIERIKIIKCQVCNEAFNIEHKFNEHLKIHPLECRMCGKLFYRRQGLKLHTARHLGLKPFKCEFCDKAFLVKQKLEEHRNCHTGNAPIKCTMCDETFRRHSNLVQHRNRHHFMLKKKVKDYICFCGEIFHSKKKLAWHKEIHDGKPKACTQCSEKFVHMASLTRHMRRAHNAEYLPDDRNPSDVNTICPICQGIFLKTSLDAHLKTHTDRKPYACSICNKDFTTKWNLKLHKWTHASRTQKPFKCELCKGAFIRENDYIAHMNAHKSVRPYTCNYCGAQFIRKYNCQRHVKEHESEKTYTCNVCNKSFHRSYYLKDHMRVHTGIRPYACHICGKTSTTKSNHNKHIQIHHAREPVSTEN